MQVPNKVFNKIRNFVKEGKEEKPTDIKKIRQCLIRHGPQDENLASQTCQLGHLGRHQRGGVISTAKKAVSMHTDGILLKIKEDEGQLDNLQGILSLL